MAELVMLRRWTAAGLAVLLLGASPVAALAASGKGSSTHTGGASTSASSAAASASSLPGTTSPFSPGVPQSAATVPTVTTPPVVTSGTSTSASNSGLTGSNAILIAVVAVALLGGVTYYIWRDARRHAPHPRGASADGAIASGARRGSKTPPKPRKPSPAERKRRKRGRAR